MDFDFLNTSAFALLVVRTILGVLFFFQAYDKLFKLGTTAVVSATRENNQIRKLPIAFVKISVVLSSAIELVGGLLLVSGVLLPLAYLILGINLVLVVLGLSFSTALWDMKHVFPRLSMLVFLLLMGQADDTYRLVHWLGLPSIFH